MSEVYRASDARLHRDIAVKIFPSFLSFDHDRLRRFEQEARAAASLNHPHIVTIHSIEKARGVHFLTMELIEGETLDHMIPEGGLQLEKFFEFAVALLDAVAAAHEKGIIHRDLKPTNIMVDKRGSIKILDFGLARMTEVTGRDSKGVSPPTHSQSEAGMVMGTVPYTSTPPD
jgi:serine/threonine protein kinase